MIEGYYVESTDGLLFAVKGLVHPPEAVVAYLRYAPDPNGERRREGLPYRRLYHFEEQEKLLRERCPACLFDDPVFGARLQGVSRERIRQVHDPCLKLADLRQREGLDELEEKAVGFADLLAGRAKVPEMSIGISGSILVGLHTPRSDLDAVVYGSENCRAVHGALRELLDEPPLPSQGWGGPRGGGQVRRLNEEETRELYASRSQDTPMGFEDFALLEGRKVIQGMFRDCEYFIRFVRTPSEVGEGYGDRRYTSLGQAEIEATVTDASQAIFTPCTYKVEDVRFKAPPQSPPTLGGKTDSLEVGDLREITSFRGRFCEQAREGERVIARGKLERVVTKEGKVHHRLLLGGRGDSLEVGG
jgi:predicted nucleotidyltransferase